MSTTKPSNKNLLPAWVYSRIFTNIFPMKLKADCTKGTFNTPIAITTWKTRPIPTVRQLMAFRLALNKKAIRISDANPIAPRIKEFKEKPSMGIISLGRPVVFCAKISAGNRAAMKRIKKAWYRFKSLLLSCYFHLCG